MTTNGGDLKSLAAKSTSRNNGDLQLSNNLTSPVNSSKQRASSQLSPTAFSDITMNSDDEFELQKLVASPPLKPDAAGKKAVVEEEEDELARIERELKEIDEMDF